VDAATDGNVAVTVTAPSLDWSGGDEHDPDTVTTHESTSLPPSNVSACSPSPFEPLPLALGEGDEPLELGLVEGDVEAPVLGLVEGDVEAPVLGLVDGDVEALEDGLACGALFVEPPPPQLATATATTAMAIGPPKRTKNERPISPPDIFTRLAAASMRFVRGRTSALLPPSHCAPAPKRKRRPQWTAFVRGGRPRLRLSLDCARDDAGAG